MSDRRTFCNWVNKQIYNHYIVINIPGGPNFLRRSKARFKEFSKFLAGETTVHLRTFRSIKIKYFSPEGATKANDFLCSSILAILLTHNFYIKTILLTNNFYGKK